MRTRAQQGSSGMAANIRRPRTVRGARPAGCRQIGRRMRGTLLAFPLHLHDLAAVGVDPELDLLAVRIDGFHLIEPAAQYRAGDVAIVAALQVADDPARRDGLAIGTVRPAGAGIVVAVVLILVTAIIVGAVVVVAVVVVAIVVDADDGARRGGLAGGGADGGGRDHGRGTGGKQNTSHDESS